LEVVDEDSPIGVGEVVSGVEDEASGGVVDSATGEAEDSEAEVEGLETEEAGVDLETGAAGVDLETGEEVDSEEVEMTSAEEASGNDLGAYVS
jgi:hypothetical protein